MDERRLLLASGSKTRAALLRSAGIPFEVVDSSVDEENLKESLRAESVAPRDVAVVLAEMKARHGSVRFPEAFVIGADQVLECDGVLFSKPGTVEEARASLEMLRGREHELHTAAVIAHDGERAWGHVETAYLRMRSFSAAFLGDYIAREGAVLCESVGAYKLESLGIQLFSRITGDYSGILGLPLLPLVAQLRELGCLLE